MSVANVGIKLTLDGAAQAEAGLRRVQDGMSALGNTAESVRGALQQLAGAFAGVVSVRAFVQAADAVTQLQNQLRLATGSAQAATAAYHQLFEIAQRSRVSFTELGGTFASIARASESLGLSQQQLLRLTETIGNAITVSGASAQASQAALTQLSQALASGVLRGEELNSILEQAPRLARALADGLGVSTGALRKLGEEGKLTAEAVIAALQSQASVLANEVQSSVVTVGQAFTQLQNSAVRLVGEIDRVSGSSGQLAVEVQAAAEALDNIALAFKDVDAAGRPVSVLGDAIAVVFETVAVVGVNVAYVIKQIGTEIGGLAAQAAAVARLDFSAAREIGRLMREDAEKARREVDALSERILNARRVAQEQRRNAPPPEPPAPPVDLKAAAAAKEATDRAKKAQDEFNKSVERGSKLYADFIAQQNGLSPDFAKKWQDLANAYKVGGLSLEQLTAAQALLLEQQPFAKALAQEQAEALKKQEEAAKAIAKAEFERVEALERNAASAQEQLQRLLDEERATAIAAEKNISLAQALEEVAIARLRERQAALMAEGDRDAEVLAIQREIDARKKLAETIGRKEARKAAAESAREAEREWRRTAENIERSLTDALMRGFESGKDFARNLRDTVVNMFNTMVLRPVIQAIVAPVAGSLTGMLGLPGTANAGQLGNSLGIASGIKSVYDTIVGGFTSLGNSVAFAANDIGAWLVNNTTGVLNQFGGTLMSNAGLLGTGASYLGGIGAGIGVGRLISGGYAISGSGNGVVNAGTAIGAVLGGPLGAVVGGAIGGLANSLFGRKLKDQGIEGTFGGDGFTGTSYQFYKGGLFRSDKTKRSALDPELDRALDQQFMALRMWSLALGDVLGGAATALDGFTRSIKISFNGLNEQQIQERLAEEFGKLGDAMAQEVLRSAALAEMGQDFLQPFVEQDQRAQQAADAYIAQFYTLLNASLSSAPLAKMGQYFLQHFVEQAQRAARTAEQQAADAYIAQFSKEGETASQTLTRLAASLQTVNAAFDTLGYTLLNASLSSADLASSLVEAFGGLDQFNAATASYYQNFYSEQERLDTAIRQLGDTFADLGLELPATKEQYRALVEAQDLTTESGRKTYAALLQLSGAFAQVTDASQAAARAAAEAARQQAQQAVDAATDAAQSALSGLRDAVAAEQDRLRERFERESDILNDRISAISDVIATLDDAIRSVRGSVETTSIASQTAARLTLQSVLTAVRGGADITGFESVIEQASATLTRNDPNLYQTREQFVKAQAQSAGLLEELNKAGGKQLTTAELQLQALKDGFDAEMARLDDLVAQAEKQINALLGIDDSVLSVEAATLKVEQAVKALEQSLLAAVAASRQPSSQSSISGLVATQVTSTQAALASGAAGTNGVYDAMAATSFADPRQAQIAQIYEDVLGRAPDVSGLQYWSSSSLSLDQIAASISSSAEAMARAISVEAQNAFIQEVNKQLGLTTNIVARANGGYTPPGLTLVGEQGPELVNFRNPAMVYSNGKTSEILGNREVVAELKALRSEVIELRAQARRTADAVNGNPEAPMLVEAVA